MRRGHLIAIASAGERIVLIGFGNGFEDVVYVLVFRLVHWMVLRLRIKRHHSEAQLVVSPIKLYLRNGCETGKGIKR